MAFFQRRLRLGSNEQFLFCCFQLGRKQLSKHFDYNKVNVGLAIHFWVFWMPKKSRDIQSYLLRFAVLGMFFGVQSYQTSWDINPGRLGLMSRVCWDFNPCKTARYQSLRSSSPYAGSCTHVKFRFRYNKLLKLGRVGRQDGCIGLWMASRTTSMRETGQPHGSGKQLSWGAEIWLLML